GLRLLEYKRGIWIGRVPEHRHAGEPGQQLLKQFKSLAGDIRHHEARPGYVAAGASQTGNKPARERIAGGWHDNRDGRGGTLSGQRPERSDCYNDFDIEVNQLGCEFREPLKPILRIAPLNGDVLPLYPSQLPQCVDKNCAVRSENRRSGTKQTDCMRLPGLLCARRERPRSRAAEQRDELAPPHHSITSSARASSDGGKSRPRA